MPSNHLEYVIFSVDDVSDINTYKKALSALDTLRATKMIGNVYMCIGSYKGKLEPSFMVTAHDWDGVVRAGMSTWMQDQESVLRVPGDERQPCTLTTVSGEHIATLGAMQEYHEGTQNKFSMPEAWTYSIKSGRYHVC